MDKNVMLVVAAVAAFFIHKKLTTVNPNQSATSKMVSQLYKWIESGGDSDATQLKFKHLISSVMSDEEIAVIYNYIFKTGNQSATQFQIVSSKYNIFT